MSYFIVPLVGAGVVGDTFRPKYIPALTSDWRIIDAGDACVVHAVTTPAIDAQILANPDVIGTDDLNAQVGDITTALETLGLPSALASAGMTYRAVFRRFAAMAQFVQRLEALMGRDGLFAKLQLKGNLDLQVGSLSLAVRQRWLAAADELGLDRSGITGTTTIREVLRILALQLINRPLRLGGL